MLNYQEICYEGPTNRIEESDNILLRIDSVTERWNKIMKEVKERRYAGPFSREQLPFKYFVQSPVGLVPKAGGKTHLIFHLSYDFGPGENRKSVNHYIPQEKCSVKYRDLDFAVLTSMNIFARNR